jgi:uncharacterized membrane protein
MQNRNVASLVIAILGALKLVLQAFGYNVLDDATINTIANCVAAIVTLYGVVATHLRHKPAVQPPAQADQQQGAQQ